jgi:hypothetical protein
MNKKIYTLLIILSIFSIHFFDGFKNIYLISRIDYESRMQKTHGYCGKESYGFYNDMVRKYEINNYKVIQENYKTYPLLRGLFYKKKLSLNKKFVLILNYPKNTLPNQLKVEGIHINLNELNLLEQKNNCYLYIFKK